MHEKVAYPAWRWDYEIATEQVLSKLNGGRILDIGTGDGAFLKGLGKRWQPFAIEGSDTMREFLRQSDMHCFDSLDECNSRGGRHVYGGHDVSGVGAHRGVRYVPGGLLETLEAGRCHRDRGAFGEATFVQAIDDRLRGYDAESSE